MKQEQYLSWFWSLIGLSWTVLSWSLLCGVFIPISKTGDANECSNYHTVAIISHASKVMLKILQQYMNWELPDVQAGFRKGRGTRDQIANTCQIIEKAREFQKNIYFCFLDYTQAFDCVYHNKLWKILKEMGIWGHSTCLLRYQYAGQVRWWLGQKSVQKLLTQMLAAGSAPPPMLAWAGALLQPSN